MYSLFGIFDLDNFLNMEKLLVSLCDLFAGKLFTTLDTKLEYTKEMMVVGQNAFNLTYIFQMGWNHQLEKSTSRKQKALTSAPVWCHVSQWRERPLGLEGWSNDERDKLSRLDLVVSVRLEIIPKLYINGHRELHNMSVFIWRLVWKKMVKFWESYYPGLQRTQGQVVIFFPRKKQGILKLIWNKVRSTPHHPHPIPGTWRYQVLLGIPEPKDTIFPGGDEPASWWMFGRILEDVNPSAPFEFQCV